MEAQSINAPSYAGTESIGTAAELERRTSALRRSILFFASVTGLIALSSLLGSLIGSETLSTIPDGLSVIMVLGFTCVALALSQQLGHIQREPRLELDAALRDAIREQIPEGGDPALALDDRNANLTAIAAGTSSLIDTTDGRAARELVCELTRRVMAAPFVALLVPTGDGRGLKVSASVGIEDGAERSDFVDAGGESEAFVGQCHSFHSGLDAGEGPAAQPGLLGSWARAMIFQPVLRGDTAIGVLAIGWSEPAASLPGNTLDAIELLGAAAAVAIDRGELLNKLDSMARTDELTGLPNRRAWEEELTRERARAARTGAPLCIAMIDLDRFRAYNERHGHQAGDRLLREASAGWRAALRATDVLARCDGEEFGLLLPACGRLDGQRLLERLRTLTPDGITFSAGIAQWDRVESMDSALGRCSNALAEAKRRGRDQAVVAPVPV